MTNRNKFYEWIRLFIFLGFALGCALGCGGYSYHTTPFANQDAETNSGLSQSPASPTTPSPSPTPDNGISLIKKHIDKVGYDVAYTTEVRANKILKIKFIPGQQDKKVSGSGYPPNYSMLAVYIAVGSSEQPTPLLSNGLSGSGQKEESPVMDFSSSFTNNCPTSDSACRETVTITVKKPNNDYWCLNFGMYCPYVHVWPTHPWNGDLVIQTDDTKGM